MWLLNLTIFKYFSSLSPMFHQLAQIWRADNAATRTCACKNFPLPLLVFPPITRRRPSPANGAT